MEDLTKYSSAYHIQYEEDANRIKADNRNTTLISLTAFFYMLTAKNKEDFACLYNIAFHENSGNFMWTLINDEEKYKQKRCESSKKYYMKTKEKKKKGRKLTGNRHWYTNGKTNKLFYPDEIPEGWEIGWTGNPANQYTKGKKITEKE